MLDQIIVEEKIEADEKYIKRKIRRNGKNNITEK